VMWKYRGYKHDQLKKIYERERERGSLIIFCGLIAFVKSSSMDFN